MSALYMHDLGAVRLSEYEATSLKLYDDVLAMPDTSDYLRKFTKRRRTMMMADIERVALWKHENA